MFLPYQIYMSAMQCNFLEILMSDIVDSLCLLQTFIFLSLFSASKIMSINYQENVKL